MDMSLPYMSAGASWMPMALPGFGHLLHAVEAFEDGRHEDDLGRLAGVALEVAAAHEVELLVGAAELDVAFEGDGVVALGHGVEQLVDGDGLLLLETLVEVFALQHLRDGELGGEADHALEAEFLEPLGVIADLGFGGVEDLEDLLLVGFGVAVDLCLGERLAGDVAAGGVADEGGGVADEEDDGVAELLEVAQLADEHGVAEVEVGGGGIEAGLDAHGDATGGGLGDAVFEGVERDDLRGSLGNQIQLLIDRGELFHALTYSERHMQQV
jgi:hypothetical protein